MSALVFNCSPRAGPRSDQLLVSARVRHTCYLDKAAHSKIVQFPAPRATTASLAGGRYEIGYVVQQYLLRLHDSVPLLRKMRYFYWPRLHAFRIPLD